MIRWLPLIALTVACKPPPEAPEGLDDSTNYLMKNFYASDALFEAGVQGFIDWYDTEGKALVGKGADLETTDAYTVGDLSADSIAHLPLEDEILIDKNKDEYGTRDLSRAKGVVSLAEMDCSWTRAEELLVRGDQNVVFSDDFEGYEREYVTSRSAFESGSADLSFDRITDDLDPFGPDYIAADFARSLLLTVNQVDPTAVLTSNIDFYEMNLDLRHGVFNISEEEVGVLAIITYNIEAAWGSAGNNALLQSYSVEINIERPNDKTLRMLAVWSEPLGGGIDPDSAIALNFAVNKSLAASERMSEICAGELEIDPEG